MNFPIPAASQELVDAETHPASLKLVDVALLEEEAVPPLRSAIDQLPEAVIPPDQHGLLMRVMRLEGVRAASLLDPDVVKALAVVQRNFTTSGFGVELGLQSEHGPIELFGVGDNLVAVVLDPEKAEEIRAQVRVCLAKVRRYLA